MKKTGVMIVVFIVTLTTFIMPVFANEGSVNSINQTGTFISADNGTVSWQIQGTALKPFIYDSSIATSVTGSGNDTYINHYGNYTVAQDFVFLIRFSNTTSDDYRCSQGYLSFNFTQTRVNNTGTITATGSSVELLQGSLAPNLTTIGTNGSVQLRWNDEFTYNSGLIIPAKSVLYTNIIIRLYYDPLSRDTELVADNYKHQIGTISLLSPSSSQFNIINNFVLMNSDYNSIEELDLLDSIYDEIVLLYERNHTDLNNIYTRNHTDLQQIHSDLQEILNAYTSNSNNVTETQSNITSTDSLVSDLHDQELTYYQQNEQALNNVGLSNFSFDSNNSAGLSTVVTDFTTLWNNIGPLQIIFTFTLSLSLATYLLRHRPITNAIKKNDRK